MQALEKPTQPKYDADEVRRRWAAIIDVILSDDDQPDPQQQNADDAKK